MGVVIELGREMVVAKSNVDGLAALAGLSTAVGGICLAVGIRRKPMDLQNYQSVHLYESTENEAPTRHPRLARAKDIITFRKRVS